MPARQRIIIWGNCQTAAVWEVLRSLPAVTERYEVLHHELWATGERLAANLAEYAGA
jgi:hypothetical protein